MKVLGIDDEAPIRLLCRVNLEYAGIEFVEAVDGWTGLAAAREEQPDLILLNVNMPVLDGWDVATDLRHHERTRDIPVVFLTARSERGEQLRGIELGAVDYITKPFNPLELAPRVRELLDRIARGEREALRREKIAEITATSGA
jgi:DNA-binding response OmpR family regulator